MWQTLFVLLVSGCHEDSITEITALCSSAGILAIFQHHLSILFLVPPPVAHAVPPHPAVPHFAQQGEDPAQTTVSWKAHFHWWQNQPACDAGLIGPSSTLTTMITYPPFLIQQDQWVLSTSSRAWVGTRADHGWILLVHHHESHAGYAAALSWWWLDESAGRVLVVHKVWRWVHQLGGCFQCHLG